MSKRNAELEKKIVEQDIAIKRFKSQLDTACQDKARFKRMYEEEKRRKNTGSIDDGSMLANVASMMGQNTGHNLKDARA